MTSSLHSWNERQEKPEEGCGLSLPLLRLELHGVAWAISTIAMISLRARKSCLIGMPVQVIHHGLMETTTGFHARVCVAKRALPRTP